MRAPRFSRVLELLQHDHGGALAEHEAVAIAVERPARALGVLVALAHRAERAVAGEAHRRHRGIGPAGERDVAEAVADRVARLLDRVHARRAGVRHEQAGAHEAVADGDARGRRVREQAVVERGRQLLADHALGASIRRRLPDALERLGGRVRRADVDAGALPVDRLRVEIGVADGLDRRTERQLHVAVERLLLVRQAERGRVEAPHLAGDLGRVLADVELRDALGAGDALDAAVPVGLRSDPVRRQHAQPGDDDATHRP